MQHLSGFQLRPIRLMIAFAVLLSAAQAVRAQDVCPNPVVDDRSIHIASAADVDAVRGRLTRFIWGRSALPTDTGVTVTPDVDSPIQCSGALARVDELRMSLGPTADGRTLPARAYHFVPNEPRHRLAIVHDGHMPENACMTPFLDAEDGLSPYGFQMAINALLAEGFDVLAVPMPLFQPDDCSQDHNALFDDASAPAGGGSALRYFFDPVLRSLNYLLQQQSFSDITMTGLSGGGWTTTVYAALDPRITTSFPVAGSLPLWMRNPSPEVPAGYGRTGIVATRAWDPSPDVASCGEFGDRENSLPSFYQIAGYPDLYVLGAYGQGRRQVQILNRNDACCFGQDQHRQPETYDSDVRNYERDVRSTLRALGNGEFRVEIDEASTDHMISRNAVHNLILGDLAGAHRNVGARTSANVFKRGPNGTLWRYGGHGWQDLGYPMIGAPAVLENALNPVDVVVRSDTNTPMHVFYDGAAWHAEALVVSGAEDSLPDGRIITDPVVNSAAQGQFEVVAQGSDFLYYRWVVSAGSQTFEAAGGDAYSIGLPALAHLADGRLGVYYRGAEDVGEMCIEQPRALYQLLADGVGAWQSPLRLGGQLTGFPSASTRQGVTRVFSIDMDGSLNAALSTDGELWQWGMVDAGGLQFAGRTSYLLMDSAFNLFARSTGNDVVRLTYADGWTASPLNLLDAGAKAVDAPVANGDGGVYWTGADGQVWRYDGASIRQLSDDVLFQDAFER